jgi:hypothetical protein
MSDSTKQPFTFPHLSSSNWGQWADNMEAYLSTKELWEYVDGSASSPSPADPNHPTAEEKKDMGDWKRKSAKASGELWLALEDDQKVHVKEAKGDPAEMWRCLEAVHVQKKPGARFLAYEALFNVRKREDESLTALMARADKAAQDIKALRPSNFTLNDLDHELLSMALICALPTEYNSFASSLLLLDSLNIDKLKAAFVNEESQRNARQSDSALAFQSSSVSTTCHFCGIPGHSEQTCFKKKAASEKAKHDRGKRQSGKGKKSQNAKEAESSQVDSKVITESAGNASALSSSQRSKWLQSRASTDWNTDTGASSHMTPHRHWFRSYSPHVVPIHIADGSVIYSAGMGSVEFQPKESLYPVVFHDVLHVPALGSNLLSLFHLTRLKGYKIRIENNQVHFDYDGKPIFSATVDNHNVGYLNGHTITPQSVNLACGSTRPLDLSLWHNCFSHLNYHDLKAMHRHNKVKGLVIKSNINPDPICETCILGKQRRHNIPKTASCKSSLLALIHTDLKGPLPVQTPVGHQYWQVFIDDKSRFLMVALLKCNLRPCSPSNSSKLMLRIKQAARF